MSDQRDRLVSAMAKLKAGGSRLKAARESLVDRAREQRDTMPDAVSAAESHLEADKGGILTHRRTRALLTERSRLDRVINTHDRRE